MSKLSQYIIKSDHIFTTKIKLTSEDNRRYFNFGDKSNEKKALISYLSSPFFDKNKTKLFNPFGVVKEFGNILDDLGFKVDIINLWDTKFKVEKDYDLFIGHCNTNFNIISQQLPSKTLKILYVNTSSPEYFLKKSKARYEKLFKSGRLNKKIKINRTSFLDEKTIQESDFIITLGKENIKTFNKEHQNKISYVDNAVFKENPIIKTLKHLEKGRNNFIFLSGSGGNIQKGVDLIIEAFARMPKKNLFIYCELEYEILKAYSTELKLPNIKYIYHYRFSRFLRNKLFKKINFQIGIGILSGQGTAFIGGMQLGFIPIMTKEMNFNIFNKNLLIKEENFSAIIETATNISSFNPKALLNLYEQTLKEQKKIYSVDIFKTKLKSIISSSVKNRL